MAVVDVMQMVIIHRRQPRQNHGPSCELPRAISIAEQDIRLERVPLDREFLVWFELLPAEVPRFGEAAHLVRTVRKLSLAGKKFAVEELRIALERAGFELAHVDAVLAHEGLD